MFVYDIDSATGYCAIKLGTGDSSAKTKGNFFERFRIESNRIYLSPTAKLNDSFKAFICIAATAAETAVASYPAWDPISRCRPARTGWRR